MSSIQSTESSPQFQRPPRLNPLEFIDYLENFYSSQYYAKLSKSIFSTSREPLNYSTHPLFPLLNFSQRKQISSSIYSQKDISSVCIHGNNIFIGDSNGNTHMYLSDKQIFYQSFRVDDTSKGIVKSIDANDNFVVVGYNGGDVIVWEIATRKSVIEIKGMKSMCRLKILYISKDTKIIELIASDNNGGVFKLSYKVGFFGVSQNVKPIYQDESNNTIYGIEILKDKKKNDINYSFIVALSTLERVRVYIITYYKEIFVSMIDKPKTERNDIFGLDVSLGVGYEPIYDENGEMIDGGGGKKEVTLLAMSMDKLILFYRIDKVYEKGALKILRISPEPIAHYKNEIEIIRIGFLTNSFLFLVTQGDMQKTIKIITTSLLPLGDYKPVKDYMKYRPATVDCKPLLHCDIFANEHEDKKSFKKYYTYREFILTSPMNIAFFCANDFFIGTLYSYRNYIVDLIEAGKWEDAMIIAIDLYKGNLLSFPDVSVNFLERKEQLTPFLKEMSIDYVNYAMSSKKKEIALLDIDTVTSKEDAINDLELEKYMNIAIDFCLNLNEVDFLLKELMNSIEKFGYGDMFVKTLEPYIFNNKLKNEYISEDSISSLFATYITKKEFTLLSHLSTYLNFNSINKEIVIKLSFNFNLFDILIYLYTCNNNEEGIISLIEKMFTAFVNTQNQQSATETKNIYENFNYMEKFNSKEGASIERRYEFMGHKLLWYIKQLIEKTVQLKTLFPKILIFLLSQKVFLKLSSFDSYVLFSLLEKLFLNKVLMSSITSFDFTSPDIAPFIETYAPMKQISYSNIKEDIYYISSISRRFSSFYILQDLNMFIIKIAPQYLNEISYDDIIESLKVLLMFNKEIRSHSYEELYDKFLYHGITVTEVCRVMAMKGEKVDIEIDEISKDYIGKITQNVLKLIKSGFEIKEDDIRKLITICEFSPFDLVKITLLELVKEFDKCVDILILKYNDEDFIFNWINNKFEEMKDNETMQSALKEHVKEKIKDLSKKSMRSTLNLLDNWFTANEKVELIQKLDDDKKSQLKYVEKLIDENVITNKYAKNSSTLSSNEISVLLLLQLKLLIILDMKDSILSLLRRRFEMYPIAETLKILVNNNVVKAIVEMYLRTDENEKALATGIKDMDERISALYKLYTKEKTRRGIERQKRQLERIKENIQEEIDDSQLEEDAIASLDYALSSNEYNEFDSSFRFCIWICEKCSDKYSSSEPFSTSERTGNLWFSLLKRLNFYLKTDSYKPFTNKLISLIESLLQKMSMYVHVKAINQEVQNDFDEFPIVKAYATKVFSSYTKLAKFLSSAKKLLESSVVIGVAEFMRTSIRGNRYSLKVCNFCKKRLITEHTEVFYAFRCGHEMHEKCAKKLVNNDGEPLCIVCKQTEIENCVSYNFNGIDNKLSYLIKKKDDDSRKSFSSSSSSFGVERVDHEKKNKMKKLKDFDKHYLQQFSMLEDQYK